MSQTDSEALLARLVLEQGTARPDQVEECLKLRAEMRERGEEPPPLDVLLLQRGYISMDQARQTVRLASSGRPSPKPSWPEEAKALAGEPSRKVGKYLRIARLGAGGMGEVWRAWDTELRRWVALKFLKSENPEELARFKREAQTAGPLNHPNIASIYEVGEHEDPSFAPGTGASEGRRHYIAMQFIDGRTLHGYPRADLRRVATLVRDAALAVQAAHDRGVIHRDLKPANLMVEEKAPRPRVYVLDFGLAKAARVDASISASGTIIGTPAYMSPEQAQGRLDDIDARSDVYSLGATLYELVAGRPPFAHENVYALLKKIADDDPAPPRSLEPRVDADLETIVLKCLEKDRGHRYPTMASLAEDLTRWLDGEAILAHPPSMVYRLRKRLAKRKAVLLALAAGLAVSGAFAVWGLPRYLRAREESRQRQRELDARREAEERAKGALDRARPHLDAGRQAMQTIDRLLTTPSWTMDELARLGKEARAEFEAALREVPSLAEAHLDAARTWILEGHADRAAERCGRAIEASPTFATAYLERAMLRLHRYEDLRHETGGGTREETPESRTLRADIEADLAKVREWSKEKKELVLAEAMLLFADGRYAESAPKFEEYAAAAVAEATGWQWAGHAWHHVPGRERQSLAALEKALQFRPRETPSLLLKGHALAALGRTGEALRAYEAALELSPKSVTARVAIGLALAKRGDHDGAIRAYTAALEDWPGYPQALGNRGIAHSDRAKALLAAGRRDEAMRSFELAVADLDALLAKRPRDAKALTVRGDAFLARGDAGAATADFTAALEADPAMVEARRGRARARAERHDAKGAAEDWTAVIEAHPRDASALMNRGMARAQLGDHARAIDDFTAALDLRPDYPEALTNRGSSRLQTGDAAGALEDQDRAIELAPKLAGAYVNRALAKTALGDSDGARDDYDQAIELDPRLPHAYTGRGSVRLALGDLEGALADAEEAVRLNPGNVNAYYVRAMARSHLGALDAAIDDFSTVLRFGPASPDALGGRGSAYDRRARARQAQGQTTEAAKDFDAAIADYRKALDVAPEDWRWREPVERALDAARQARGK